MTIRKLILTRNRPDGLRSRVSSASIVSRLRAARLGFDSHEGQGPGALSPEVKWLEREDSHLVPKSKNACKYTFTLPYVFMAWRLGNHRIRLHGVVFS